jgi:hypothetical protein
VQTLRVGSFGFEPAKRAFTAAARRHLRSCANEFLRNGASDTPAAAGHDGLAPSEIEQSFLPDVCALSGVFSRRSWIFFDAGMKRDDRSVAKNLCRW